MSSLPGPQIESSPAEKFFGLVARPFSLTPDLRFAYHSRSHTHALDEVTSALRRREGLVVVTGPVGTGKTMLCRSMLESFESRTFLSVILDPGLEVEDLLRKILSDFGIISGLDAPAGPMSEVTRHQFVSTLQQFLASLIPLQAHAVIMIDEAQRLNPRVLEEIRLLSNFETDEAKLLQIVLVGQPELGQVLRSPMMQQLNQRVSRRCELQPLSEAEVGDYIERRLTVAASPGVLAGDKDALPADLSQLAKFSPEAVTSVAGISGGIPRLVNTLCDRALDVAYERKIRTVDPDAVLAAAERLHLDVPSEFVPAAARRTWLWAAGAAALVLLVLAGWWLGSDRSAPAPELSALPATGPLSQRSVPERNAPITTPSRDAAPASPQAAPAPPERGPSAVPSSPAPPPPAPRPAAPQAGTFQIAVSSFRTEARAQEVATALKDLQLPASVRLDATGTWYRVLAGPFSTRESAQAAQDALTKNGYADTRILLSAPETR